MKQTQNLDVEHILQKQNKARHTKQGKKIAKHDLIHFSFDPQDSSSLPITKPGWINSLEHTVLSELWDQSEKGWQYLLEELGSESAETEKVVVVVGDPAIHVALMGQCLSLQKERMGSFHLDAGSITVVDFPDGPAGRGVIQCINYTAHLGRWSIPITRSMVNG